MTSEPTIEQGTLPTPGSDVPFTIHRPAGHGPFPLFLYIPGGGFRIPTRRALANSIAVATAYAGPAATTDDPRLAPALTPDLRDLPPTLLVTYGQDPLRDEGSSYAIRLRDAGVAVQAVAIPDAPHGYLTSTKHERFRNEP